MKTKALLSPPRYFSHENLEFGNIIKINFEPVKDAIGYLIEVSEDDGINFKLLGYTKDNYYIDYSITLFSDYNKEYSYIYRVASISNYEEVPSNFSKGYKVSIPKKPSDLEFSYEGEIETHSKVFNILNNKENKLLIQNLENNLEVYKLSTLSTEYEKNITSDYILSDTSTPIEIKELSDDFGFYIRYNSGTIQYINKTTLNPYITLNTYGKQIKKFEVNENNDLIVILEILKDKEELIIYKKEDILIKQINFVESEIKHSNILDFKIKENILYVLDKNSQFFIYEIDRVYGTLKFVQSLFDKGQNLLPFDIFKKKSHQYKNNIINYFEIDTTLNDKEKNNLKYNILNNELHEITYNEISNYIKQCSTSSNNIYNDFKNYIAMKLNTVFNLIIQANKNQIELNKLNQFFINYLESYMFEYYTERIFKSLKKYYEYELKYLNNSEIIISETNNIIIIKSCYYIYFIDLFNYRINEYFNCLLPNKEIENVFLKEYNIQSNDDIYKSALLQNNDRFIYEVKYFPELNNIGIYFEDLSSNYILNEQLQIEIDNCFSYQYIDFYNIDFEGNFTDLIINNQYNENFTSLKGFGYDYIQKYNYNINLNEATIYVYNNKFYKCLKDVFFFDRNNQNLNELLLFEIENNILIEINKEKINHFSLNTRLYITSKELKYDNRNFSFHDIEMTSEYTSEIDYIYLNNLKIFKSNIYNNQYIDFNFDSTGDNVFIYSLDKSFYGEQIKCVTLFLLNDFYLESNNIIFKENINIRHFTLAGKFNSSIFIPTTEPFNFICSKKDFENKDYIYLFDSSNLTFANEQSQIKVKSPFMLCNYFVINALFKRKIIIDEEKDLNYFFIYNEHQKNDYEKIVYGNSKKTTWRWKRNNDLLKYDSFLGIRVSVDKENWNYFNKDINSYTCKKELNDGIHTFYLQFQDLNGNWSKTMKSIYHLKTLKPSIPILEDIIYDKQDKGKPLLKWNYDTEVVKYKITYDNNLVYYPIKTNYHTPEVSFNLHNSKNNNIDIELISYDKYGNESDKALWKFNPNNSIDSPFEVFYNKFTNNTKPLFRWKNVSELTIVEYIYSFNNETEIKTNELYCIPDKDLTNGVHIFYLKAIDSLGQITDEYNFYFEINNDNSFFPILKEETIKQTKNCNLNNIIFNFEPDNSQYKQMYSFDNFKNSFSFNNYKLDLSNSIYLKEGNNTIYFKYIDSFNNESEVLEYIFYINSKEIKKPTILNTKNIFIDIPKIIWTKNNNIKEYKIKLFFENNIIFEETTINSDWSPLYSLKNGNYIFELIAIDYYLNQTDKIIYNFIIDDTIPNKPNILETNILNNEFNLKINNIKDNEYSVYRIKKVEQLQNSIFQKFNKYINLKNLSIGVYLLELKIINENGYESESIKYSFNIEDNSIDKELKIDNYNLEYYYDKINNEIKIISYKDFKNFEKIILNNGILFNSNDIQIVEGD